jgi:hypothetical protein
MIGAAFEATPSGKTALLHPAEAEVTLSPRTRALAS